MNNAEKLALIVESKKGNITDHIRHFFMLRIFRIEAKNGYSGINWYGTLSPWILEKFETDDGFQVIPNQEGKNGKKFTAINWINQNASK